MPNWISGSSVGPSALPSAPVAWMVFSTSSLLRARRRAAGGYRRWCRPWPGRARAAGFFWLLGLLRSLGRSTVLCSVTSVASRWRIGQKGRGKVEIGDGRVVVGLVERGVAAHLGGGGRVLLAVDETRRTANGVRQWCCASATREETPPCRPGRRARPPARARAAPLRWTSRIDVDHVARIEVEGLHHVQAVLRVVEGERAGRQQLCRVRRDGPDRGPDSAAWSAPAHR